MVGEVEASQQRKQQSDQPEPSQNHRHHPQPAQQSDGAVEGSVSSDPTNLIRGRIRIETC